MFYSSLRLVSVIVRDGKRDHTQLLTPTPIYDRWQGLGLQSLAMK